jgi:hypothetical protein
MSLMNDYNTIFNPTDLHLNKPIDNNGLRRKNIDLIVEDLSKFVIGGLYKLWWVDIYHTTFFFV